MMRKWSINQVRGEQGARSRERVLTAGTQCFVLFLICFVQINLFAQNRQQANPAFPRLEPDSRALEFYQLSRRGTPLSWVELAEISLWASGDSSASNLERIRTSVTAMNSDADFPASGRERAEFILAWLHRNILRSYSLYQTRIDTTLTNGRFNCVSSAVLYVIFCESAGIRTSGVITREHAFVMVHVDGQDIDVETTNRLGFDPGNRREFHDQFGRLTGFSYVPAQNYRDRHTIGKVELISLILNNRIAEFERRNSFASSVPLAIDRAALLFGESLAVTPEAYASELLFADPRKDLMDRLINYGSTLLRANREEDSLRWAEAASLRYPEANRWQEYNMAAVNNRITRFIRDRRIQDARNFLDNNREILIEANYTRLEIVVIDAELLSRANNSATAEEGNSVIDAIERARENGKMSERRAAELTTFTIQRTAAALTAPAASASSARDWRAAINYLESALSIHGANRELEQALRTYRGNLATDYHNRFAAEWNRRNYDEAQRILEEALAEFPDNRQLLNNMQTVERHRGQN